LSLLMVVCTGGQPLSIVTEVTLMRLAPPASVPQLQWTFSLLNTASGAQGCSHVLAPMRTQMIALEKKAWETAEPGRAARAHALREAYLRNHPSLVANMPVATPASVGCGPSASNSAYCGEASRFNGDGGLLKLAAIIRQAVRGCVVSS
jgi:hypothetical protein